MHLCLCLEIALLSFLVVKSSDNHSEIGNTLVKWTSKSYWKWDGKANSFQTWQRLQVHWRGEWVEAERWALFSRSQVKLTIKRHTAIFFEAKIQKERPLPHIKGCIFQQSIHSTEERLRVMLQRLRFHRISSCSCSNSRWMDLPINKTCFGLNTDC